jgi:hypothetical protein
MSDQTTNTSTWKNDAQALAHQIELIQYCHDLLLTFSGKEQGRLELEQKKGELINALYYALEPDLLTLAKGWMRSMQFRDFASTRSYQEALSTLAKSAFGAIVDAIPTLRIDPERNVRKLLITISRRDLYDQEHKIYNSNHRLSPKKESQVQSGELAAAMWQSTAEQSDTENIYSDIKDENSTDFEEKLLQQDWVDTIWPVVEGFWQQRLSPDDRWLIQLRWFQTPPVPFKDIAQQLGPGWTEAALKQRHHRILRKTFQYLQSQNLVDNDDI